LPPGIWYDINAYNWTKSVGQYFELQSPITSINVLLRGGYIIARQLPHITTEQTRNGDFILEVGLDSNGMASGQLFWDSGDGLDNLILGQFNIFEFVAQNVIKPHLFKKKKKLLFV
jgi:alpha-glucosidase (family GH31 glycosyl hydrolase)